MPFQSMEGLFQFSQFSNLKNEFIWGGGGEKIKTFHPYDSNLQINPETPDTSASTQKSQRGPNGSVCTWKFSALLGILHCPETYIPHCLGYKRSLD